MYYEHDSIQEQYPWQHYVNTVRSAVLSTLRQHFPVLVGGLQLRAQLQVPQVVVEEVQSDILGEHDVE